MEYLDERFPHPPLLPVYPVSRAESRLWIYRIERDWCSLIPKIEVQDSDEARTELRDSIVSIASIFDEMPYFMSEEFTLVDCCLAPLLWRLPSYSISLPKDRQTKPLLSYMDKLFERDAFQSSLSDLEREIRA